MKEILVSLVTLLIYKVLKPFLIRFSIALCLVTLLIYKVLKPPSALGIALTRLSYFTDLQGSQTSPFSLLDEIMLSYFTDLQGSQTHLRIENYMLKLSYFTDLQGSQTVAVLI